MSKENISLSPTEKFLISTDSASTVAYGMKGLNWKGRIHYRLIIWQSYITIKRFYRKALKQKDCYYGPFKGEFGHFLLHNLPFLVHLHKKGVKIHYCGMELHKPFLIDEKGDSIIHEWFPLPDFFAESAPAANETILPERLKGIVEDFKNKARREGKPLLDISKNNMYWYVFRNWQLEDKQSVYVLSKVSGGKKENTCVIFPRKKGGKTTPNNGEPWDYSEIARLVSPYFDRVFLVGHPSFSAEVTTHGNIELKVSSDNADTLKYCANASLIITQHSGAVHLGAYVKTPVLIIFKGQPPVKGLMDTVRFRKNLTAQSLNYALNMQEIENFVASGIYK